MTLIGNIPYKIGDSFEETKLDLILRKKFSDRVSLYSSHRYSEIHLFGNLFESICYLWYTDNRLTTIEYRFDKEHFILFKEAINSCLPSDNQLKIDPYINGYALESYQDNVAISIEELNEHYFLLKLSEHPSLPRIKTT